MYYKDFLLKLANDGSKLNVPVDMIPILNKKDSLFISFDINLAKLCEKGQLINKIEVCLQESVQNVIEYCVLEFKGYVFDVAKQKSDGVLEFPAFQNYPLPVFEFDKISMDCQLHVVHSHDTDIPFDCLTLTANIIKVQDPTIFDKIPLEWSYCLEPSWNSLKIKFEKANGSIIISPGIGWISWSNWIEVCRKKYNEADESEEDSTNFKGYLNNMEMGIELKTLNFLNMKPTTLEENMHLYMQWKSLRANLRTNLMHEEKDENNLDIEILK